MGWSIGFTRIFFAILAGFLAIFVASEYSCRKGLNLYLAFVITVLLIVAIGYFIKRLVNFLCIDFLDKIGGLAINVCVWLILYMNIIMPTVMTCENYTLDKSSGRIYKTISCFVKSKIPLFKNYGFSYTHLKSKLQNFKNKT
ncbi:MAG: hypothetical protein LBQ99_01495 [Endomicrobium sp.]|nr:hypothetical protein [Endomicrobium sp.]